MQTSINTALFDATLDKLKQMEQHTAQIDILKTKIRCNTERCQEYLTNHQLLQDGSYRHSCKGVLEEIAKKYSPESLEGLVLSIAISSIDAWAKSFEDIINLRTIYENYNTTRALVAIEALNRCLSIIRDHLEELTID